MACRGRRFGALAGSSCFLLLRLLLLLLLPSSSAAAAAAAWGWPPLLVGGTGRCCSPGPCGVESASSGSRALEADCNVSLSFVSAAPVVAPREDRERPDLPRHWKKFQPGPVTSRERFQGPRSALWPRQKGQKGKAGACLGRAAKRTGRGQTGHRTPRHQQPRLPTDPAARPRPSSPQRSGRSWPSQTTSTWDHRGDKTPPAPLSAFPGTQNGPAATTKSLASKAVGAPLPPTALLEQAPNKSKAHFHRKSRNNNLALQARGHQPVQVAPALGAIQAKSKPRGPADHRRPPAAKVPGPPSQPGSRAACWRTAQGSPPK